MSGNLVPCNVNREIVDVWDVFFRLFSIFGKVKRNQKQEIRFPKKCLLRLRVTQKLCRNPCFFSLSNLAFGRIGKSCLCIILLLLF